MSSFKEKNNTFNDEVLSIKNLSYSYFQGGKEIRVLDNISFNIKKGEMVALSGPSGSGKTTLLNLIGLLEKANIGKVYLKGKVINPIIPFERNLVRLKNIGFVFQFHRLLSEFSARENIAIPQMLSGLNLKLALKRSDELLDMFGIIKRKHHRPGMLSGGEQQRVSIARGLANAPDILLADEPTGNLDPTTGMDVFNQLKLIVEKSGLTCLVVTHNNKLAKKMDRVLLLEKGKISCD